MKNILAHLEVSAVLPAVLGCALAVGRRFDSYIEGLHMRPGQPDVIAAGADGFVAAAPDLVSGFEREAKDRAEKARVTFETFMHEHHLVRPVDGKVGLSADWRIETANGPSAIGSIGRVFDLIVVGRPLRDSVAPSMAALESALFETGRPILVAPPVAPPTLGEHVMIAWNGSTETARTMAFAMPFLRQAQKVSVVAVERNVAGPSAAEAALALRRHGITADWREVLLNNRSVGQVLLAEAADLSCDLLVKGAYTQSRLRQMIFGGATSHILAEAELPVLMAN
ncbi:Universal stress protein family protein [Arboricoccus pini]|uniref:Universal stress protein family protein n=1 Tax=Arboricoccus pini TaxID=1963835 RepID=A0A212QNA9_9PROT|nr:universal stress protein [Arboricoccus pini]SNB60879.1 Universal stress protein family protein [Arboricoccus pini]